VHRFAHDGSVVVIRRTVARNLLPNILSSIFAITAHTYVELFL